MKAMVATATTATNSPVKIRKVKLQAQLYHGSRHGRVQVVANDLRLTSSDTTASANNTDVAPEADVIASLLSLFTNECPPALPTPI
jgi:hypothetical protein